MGVLGIAGRVALGKTRIPSGGGGFGEGDLDWSNFSTSTNSGTVTAGASGTIHIDISFETGESDISFYKNGSLEFTAGGYFGGGGPYTVSVSNGDAMYFTITRSGCPPFFGYCNETVTITVRNEDASGTVIDIITATNY